MNLKKKRQILESETDTDIDEDEEIGEDEVIRTKVT